MDAHTSVNKLQCRKPCLGLTHSHRSAMRGQLESQHNHWNLASPQLPWGTTDASDETKPQQYCKVTTWEGGSFNLPSTTPVCTSVKEPGTVPRTLLSNPRHLTLRRERKNQAGLVGRQTTTPSPYSEPRSWNSISFDSRKRWHACLYMPLGIWGWFK